MKTRLLQIGLLVIVIFFSCNSNTQRRSASSDLHQDLTQIRERGKLVALTDFNSTSYFIYKGEPMGFQFELLRAFADWLQIELEIRTENDLKVSFELLERGDADLLAYNLSVSNDRKKLIRFSDPIGQTRQVLVQRRPANWRSMTIDDIDRSLLRNQIDLGGKTVYVQSGSAYTQRLRNLQDEIGDSITILEVPMEVEELIGLVANGEIDYTIADENVASVNRTYYSILDTDTPVSFPQNLAWAVRRNGSDELMERLNEWIAGYRNSTEYALLYAKYFQNDRSKRIVESDYYSLSSGKVSRWDDYFRTFSSTIGWDWRLVASLACQESRFDPDVQSWAGAYGLMQLMPSTGEHYGIDIKSSPEKNIMAGVKYLGWLDSVFTDKIPDSSERMKFVLASYNVGPGHVLDARQLALKNGRDPNVWDDNVAYYLLMKSDPDYFRDPVVEHGYCRGEEPYNFVKEILERYDHYKNFIPER